MDDKCELCGNHCLVFDYKGQPMFTEADAWITWGYIDWSEFLAELDAVLPEWRYSQAQSWQDMIRREYYSYSLKKCRAVIDTSLVDDATLALWHSWYFEQEVLAMGLNRLILLHGIR